MKRQYEAPSIVTTVRRDPEHAMKIVARWSDRAAREMFEVWFRMATGRWPWQPRKGAR
jgi:hypothetical protein